MRKRYITVATALCLLCSVTFTSCIGSFSLTNKMLSWNKQIGSKFVNELVFFAFWILPVYEVTVAADLLVLNSIEFWSGNNALEASTKAIDTEQGRYLVDCDGKGYTVTCEATGETFRLDFDTDSQTWSFKNDSGSYPFMTMVDDMHVKMITPDGSFMTVSLDDYGLMAYRSATGTPAMGMTAMR